MFLKKSLLFTTALALLMFAGQTSAQPTVSLKHVTDGTAGTVAGADTEIVVKISQTGVNDFPGLATAPGLNIDVAFDASVVSLTGTGGLVESPIEGGVRLTLFAPFVGSLVVPESVNLTFTTVADVTDTEFTIGVTGASTRIGGADVAIPLSKTLTFNADDGNGDTGMPPDGNGDTGMPPDGNGDTGMPPDGDGTTVSLTSGGASIVRDVGAGADVVVNVAIPGLTANVGGGEITFSVDPSVATIKAVTPDMSVVKSEGLKLVLVVPPMMLQGGALGSVTFTTDADYDGGMFTIGVESLELLTTDGRMSVAAGAPVVVNKPLPTLMGPEDDVMIMPGGSASAMVTAAGFVGAVTYEGADEDGNVTATEPGEVTVTATDGIDPATASATITFVWGPFTATSDAEAAVVVMPGGSNSATVSSEGQAEGATVAFALEEGSSEGVALDAETGVVSASGPGTAIVTAWVGDVGSDPVSVVFEQGALTLTSDADAAVTVLPGGSGMVTLTTSGQAEGAEVTYALVEGAEGVTLDAEAGTVSATGAGMGSVTAWVGDVGSDPVSVVFEQGALTLTSDADAAVTVLPGGSGMVTLTTSGQAEGAEVTYALVEGAEGVTLDAEAGTVSATGAGMGSVTAWVGDVGSDPVSVVFEQGALTLTSDADAAVTVLPGGSGMVTLTTSGQAEGAEVTYALVEGAEGVTLDAEAGTVSATGAGMGSVTAWVGDVGSDPVSVVFEQGALTLTSDMTEVAIGPDGGSATLTASGQAEGAEVTYALGEGSGGTLDGATVSASVVTTATVTASVGDVMSNAVEIAFVPSLHTEMTTVMFEDFGASAEASVTAIGFPEGAEIRFKITGGTGFATADGAATWTVSTDKAGDVTMEATDGTSTTAPLTITFANPAPYLTADNSDVIIPEGGEVTVTVTATGLGADISWTVSEVTGTATVNISTDGATATLNAVDSDDLSQTSTVTLIAADGTMTTAPTTITFRKMPEVTTDMPDVEVPQAVVPSESSTVVAVGFPDGTEITFNVEVTSGESYVSHSSDGNVLTLTATGTATVSVTATGGDITTSAVEVAFTQALPAAPASVVVQDQEGDNGHYVMVSFANSANHADVSQYRVYREMMVNTTMDADGNVVVSDEPVATWVPWAVIDAMDNDDEEGMTRAVVPVTDATATRWGVAAEKGMDSAEITPAGKRVFSKESVQLMAQLLGVDPNRIVTEDELSKMFMPSADYINSIIGGRKNVVFAALDPDLSVLVGGDLAVPQNIRTSGGPIVSSPITAADGMVGAVDDTAPAAATDLAADVETGIVTWTASADDGGLDMVMYRGHAIIIPHVLGYRIMGGASEDAMIDIGVVPAGSTSFQVPQALIESLINQGVPAVLVTVVAMDGTNMTPSVPLVVELVPTRKAFADADGGPVYVVRLDRHGAMTPLVVDFEDFVAFTMAFNTDETHENWRVFVQADLNDDKMVNFDDFILFFSSYGKEAQGPAGKSLIPPPGVNETAELSLRLGSDRVVAGENVFVDVSLANVQALMGYGFVLHYDAEKFEFVEVVPAAEDLLLSSGGETPLLKGWSPEAGQVHVMNGIVNGSEVSGGGDIVRLVFRVLRNFEDDARFEIAEGLVFDPSQLANPLTGGVLDIQTTPTEFALLQNFPNPFNPDTTIGYELAESADVTLQIYNVVGQVVRTLMAAESQSVGRYQVRWDGMDDRGMPVSSGIYFYQISAGKFQDVRKLMLLK